MIGEKLVAGLARLQSFQGSNGSSRRWTPLVSRHLRRRTEPSSSVVGSFEGIVEQLRDQFDLLI